MKKLLNLIETLFKYYLIENLIEVSINYETY